MLALAQLEPMAMVGKTEMAASALQATMGAQTSPMDAKVSDVPLLNV